MQLIKASITEAQLRDLLPEIPQQAKIAAVSFDYDEKHLNIIFRLTEVPILANGA